LNDEDDFTNGESVTETVANGPEASEPGEPLGPVWHSANRSIQSEARASGLRLAQMSSAIGLVLTTLLLAYKVFQVLITPEIILGAPGLFSVETVMAATGLFALLPIVVVIVTAHVAISRGVLFDLHGRTLAILGLVGGYFYLACFVLDVVMAVLSCAAEPAANGTTFLRQF
jgi:hypothetical protein